MPVWVFFLSSLSRKKGVLRLQEVRAGGPPPYVVLSPPVWDPSQFAPRHPLPQNLSAKSDSNACSGFLSQDFCLVTISKGEKYISLSLSYAALSYTVCPWKSQILVFLLSPSLVFILCFPTAGVTCVCGRSKDQIWWVYVRAETHF